MQVFKACIDNSTREWKQSEMTSYVYKDDQGRIYIPLDIHFPDKGGKLHTYTITKAQIEFLKPNCAYVVSGPLYAFVSRASTDLGLEVSEHGKAGEGPWKGSYVDKDSRARINFTLTAKKVIFQEKTYTMIEKITKNVLSVETTKKDFAKAAKKRKRMEYTDPCASPKEYNTFLPGLIRRGIRTPKMKFSVTISWSKRRTVEEEEKLLYAIVDTTKNLVGKKNIAKSEVDVSLRYKRHADIYLKEVKDSGMPCFFKCSKCISSNGEECTPCRERQNMIVERLVLCFDVVPAPSSYELTVEFKVKFAFKPKKDEETNQATTEEKKAVEPEDMWAVEPEDMWEVEPEYMCEVEPEDMCAVEPEEDMCV